MSSKSCECGCGLPAPIAPHTDRSRGWVRGAPLRFVRGHHAKGERGSAWAGDQVGYSGVHRWLQKHYPKSGLCEQCSAIAGVNCRRTEYANISGEYRRDRIDYRELCPSCHRRLDGCNPARGERSGGAKLTADQVLIIRSSKESQTKIAVRFGISPGHVSRLQTGLRWKHLVSAA